jgi:DNA-binding LytR/AlgR family response regulator
MRVVILEDEPLIARRLERLTRNLLADELERIDCVATLAQARACLERNDGAVLLLDLNLSGQDGFDIVSQAAVESFHTIVVSANTDRALEAFELGVVDFVPKPFSAERLAKAFDRVKTRNADVRTRFLAVSIGGKVELISIESVVAVHGDDDYSSLETADGRRHLHRKTLTALEQLLPANFVRVHRSHIVNMDCVARIVAQDRGNRSILLKSGTSVPIGRSYAGAFAGRVIE